MMKASRDQFARAALAVGSSALLLAIVLVGAGPLQTSGRGSINDLPPWAIEPQGVEFVVAPPAVQSSPRTMLSSWAGQAVARREVEPRQPLAPKPMEPRAEP